MLAAQTSTGLPPKLDSMWRTPRQGPHGGGEGGPTVLENLLTKGPLSGRRTARPFQVFLAEALFVSPLQSSESAAPDDVRCAVATALLRVGVRGCAAQMAGEFGDHPDTAAARMNWALATIHEVYPTRSTTRTPNARPLPVAS
jgi:hypothetical protein